MSQPLRTPSEHRAAVAAWAATAPANDSAVFGRKSRSSARHADLSRKLSAILEWRALNDSAATWMPAIADNDNAPTTIDASGTARPSPEFLLQACEGVGFALRGGRLVPVDGDIERCPVTGTITRLGRLKLSIGSVHRWGAPRGAVTEYQSGRSWRRPKEEPERAKGQDGPDREDVAASNAFYEWMLGVDRPDTGVMPRATGEYARGFLQGCVHGRDDSKMPPNDAVERESVRRYVADRLTSEEMAILEAALTASNFADIGRLTGCTNEKAAERAGKRALLAVAERLTEILRAA